MSLDDNSNDYNSAEINENQIFVQLLSKYKIIFEKSPAFSNRRIQHNARSALTKEFNRKCETNLTLKQILRKINNIKSRLKEKNFKNLSRAKQLPYLEWEQTFLNLWIGNGITVATNIENKLQKKTTEGVVPEDVIMKFEEDCNSIEEIPESPSETSTHDRECNTEPEPLRGVKDEEGDGYEYLSLEELKRGVLVCQIKTLKAQEASARAKEKLDLYKLSLLQQNKNIN